MKKSHLLFVSLVAMASTLVACGSTTGGQGGGHASSSSSHIVEGGNENGATGAYSYVASSYEDRAEILGKLEGYAMSNYLSGLPLYENGGYVMYNSRIVKGTNTYIPGYGFGILSEGRITEDLASESNAAYKKYYHTWEPSDPATINYLNSDGSQVSDLASYATSGYWGTKMNATKDGYEWYGVLAKESRPVAVNMNPSTGLASKWKFHVRTGADGLKYSTSSKVFSAFNERGVEAEDYLTIFKELLCQQNNLYRGKELASKTGSGGIKGAKAFFDATANGTDSDAAKAAWDNIGIKLGSDDQGAYLEIELLAPTTQFYAMYNLASNLYQPIPADFVSAIGGMKNYGNYSSDKTKTPLDHFLSLSPYTLDTWASGQTITFKRNDSWFERSSEDSSISSRHSIAGIHIAVLAGYEEDNTVPFKSFLAGELDSASIPDVYLEEYKNNPAATTVPGDSVFKLNINSCTKDAWVEKFGVEGEITQTQESDYWNVKPWMSNASFLDGLMFSINRPEVATKYGSIPSVDYFGTSYMANPETGLSYNDTDAHKQAVVASGLEDEGFLSDENYERTYGYDLEVAKALFQKAGEELVASGEVERNQTLEIDIWWMYSNQINKIGADIKTYLEAAFNTSKAHTELGLTLNVVNDAGANWYDVYYDHLLVGQFDLGFGSISGNELNPLNFMEVLKSNNDSGFTLNWGPDTSIADGSLVYDGKVWSYDALWKAADQGALVDHGVEVPPVVLSYGEEWYEITPDGLEITFSYTLNNTKAVLGDNAANIDECDIEILDFYFYGCVSYASDVLFVGDDYATAIDEEAQTVTFVLDSGSWEYLLSEDYGYVGLGVDFQISILGAAATSSSETYVVLPEIPAVAE